MNEAINRGDILTRLARAAIARKLSLSFDELATVEANWLPGEPSSLRKDRISRTCRLSED